MWCDSVRLPLPFDTLDRSRSDEQPLVAGGLASYRKGQMPVPRVQKVL